VLDPKKERTVPVVSVNSAAAKEPIAEIIRRIPNYHNNNEDTVGKGGRIQVLQTIGQGNGAAPKEEWVDVDHSNRVTARWVFLHEIQRRHNSLTAMPASACCRNPMICSSLYRLFFMSVIPL
jgi:type III restriction enzyme